MKRYINNGIMKKNLVLTLMALLLLSCGNSKQTTLSKETDANNVVVGPEFSADSAYAYCKAQCDFGPRTMNSSAHDECEAWIMDCRQGQGVWTRSDGTEDDTKGI